MRFRVSAEATSEDKIAELELWLGIRLPSDYKAFLLDQNGGSQPIPDAFRVDTGEVSMVSAFYSIDAKVNSNDLRAHAEHLRGELPEDTIAIGRDIGGNYLCLVLTGEMQGSVMFKDHESAGDLAFCSRSFADFENGLFEYK